MSLNFNTDRCLRRILNLVAIMLAITLFSDIMFKHIIEDSHRKQARYNLEHIVSCVGSLENEHMVTKAKALQICTDKMRTSLTGDVYVFNRSTYKFAYENSNDVPKDIYFTKNSVGKIAKDWSSLLVARNYMTTNVDSTYGDNVSYNFDGSPEWVEWKHYNKCVIVQGTQEDEVLGQFKWLRLTIVIAVALLAFIMIMTELIRSRKRAMYEQE